MDDTTLNRRALEVFDEVCDLPDQKRAAALDEHCKDNDPLRRRVEALLQQDARDDAPISATTFGRGANLIAADITSESTALPDTIGRYRIIRQIGEGGMGIVYEAEQDSPRRRVALKVVRPGFISPQQLRRFRHESHILGRLQHPGIAHVYEASVADADHARVPFFAMEFIDGLPLDQHVTQHTLTTPQKLELIARVCDAVHHAHQREVIHRDLKPANILVKADSGVAPTSSTTIIDAIGQPKILDFGVARLTERESHVTMQTSAGQIIGTLAYMSPEQIEADPEGIDTRSDVYAIGVMLYEVLAGTSPLPLRDLPIAQAAQLVREKDPTRLGQIDRTFQGDIETIVAKALEKDRTRRYDSAAALADDIRRFLRDEPIVARPATTMYQLRKFARRNRALVAGTLATFTVLILGLTAVSILLVIVSNQRDEAIELKDAADSATQTAIKARNNAEQAQQRAIEARNEAQQVAQFQASMLAGVNVPASGERALKDFKDRLIRAAEDASEADRTAIEEAVDSLVGPDLVRFIIDDAILQPAAKRIETGLRKITPASRRGIHNGLGIAYEKFGLNLNAEQQFKHAIAIALESGVSDTDLSLIDTRQRLSLSYHYLDRPEQALPHALAINKINHQTHGPFDIRTLATDRAIIAMYLKARRLDDAEDLCETLIQRLDAPDTPQEASEVRTSVDDDLAYVYVFRGHPDLAWDHLKTYRSEIDIREVMRVRSLGFATLLSIIFIAERRFDDAEILTNHAVAEYRSRRGDDHPWTIDAKLLLAELRFAQQRIPETISILEDIVETQTRALSQDEYRIATTRLRLIHPLLLEGRIEAATDLANRALPAIRNIADPDTYAAALADIAEAHIHLANERPAEALPTARQARATLESLAGPLAPETMTARQLQGAALLALGRETEARHTLTPILTHPWTPPPLKSEATHLLSRSP